MFDQSVIDFACAQLPRYLMQQRWYPAKDAGAPQVKLERWLPFDSEGASAAIIVWLIHPPGRECFRLFVPLACLPNASSSEELAQVAGHHMLGRVPARDAVLVDAFAVDAFVRAFVRMLTSGAADGAASAELHARQTARLGAADAAAATAGEIRRSTTEQSNTSIRIGESAMLKVIRKLEDGPHPELEMGRFLTSTAHFPATPALLAWLDLSNTTVAIMQVFVPNQGDGWTWIAQRLAEGAAGQAAAIEWIRGLGRATAQMHLALALRTGDADFDPEPATTADWQRWSEQTGTMAQRAQDALAAAGERLDLTARALANVFRERDPTHALSQLLPNGPVFKTRHHGDYHLGQVLVCGDEATIVDFEGEPLRPLAERRAKHCPLRDVAGMLRSFHYAATVYAGSASCNVVAELERWCAGASAAFLDSYLELGATGPGCPRDTDEARRLVKFFSIEKALYEVSYELANRPTWVSIPLRSVVDLIRAPSASVHRAPHGAELLNERGVRFRLWAPACTVVQLELEPANGVSGRLLAMTSGADGWHELTVAEAGAGTLYRFVLPDGMKVPDPASRYQPQDVHGPSEVIDPAAFSWQTGAWQGRPWHEAVVYEMHVGAFTPAGTFRAAIERLEHLVTLGITAIEVMPIADFPGKCNWGYDGVSLYAPDSSYGRPEDFKAFIDAAHACGIMVILDVVYNHFGPDGNFLPVFAPAFFTDRHKTPWGSAVNFDGSHSAPVREFIIHNALYWIEEYRLDGLRLDAVHAILDDGERHLLDELAERVRELRPNVHLVLENEENQATRLARAPDGMPLHYTAQWNDDLHHVLHVAASGESTGYYAEYLADAEKLGRALAEGFAFQGQMMEFRGAPRGEPSAMLPPSAFVGFIQNHDQIGNRAFGERITTIAPAAAVRAVAAVYLLLPQTPMLFMGEEWGATSPFPFFCDFDGELAKKVRQGRRLEFAKFPEFQDEAMRARIPDPQADDTFSSAKLRWSELVKPAHSAWLELYKALIARRRDSILPLLPMGPHAGSYQVIGPGMVAVQWRGDGGSQLQLVANLSGVASGGFPTSRGRRIWQEGDEAVEGKVAPWSVCWSIGIAA